MRIVQKDPSLCAKTIKKFEKQAKVFVKPRDKEEKGIKEIFENNPDFLSCEYKIQPGGS